MSFYGTTLGFCPPSDNSCFLFLSFHSVRNLSLGTRHVTSLIITAVGAVYLGQLTNKWTGDSFKDWHFEQINKMILLAMDI